MCPEWAEVGKVGPVVEPQFKGGGTVGSKSIAMFCSFRLFAV
jgi:hypothetical protein